MASQKKKDDPYKNLKEHKAIMQILNGLYGNCLDVNIIESVVSSQQWNLQKTIGILSEMLANAAPDTNGQNAAGNQNAAYSKITKKQPKTPKPPANNQNRPNTERKPKNPHNPTRTKEFERICSKILSGHKVLIFLRGVPGCGKSYLAKELVSNTLNMDYKFFVFSTDDYFHKGGKYNYNPTLISEAHGWNQKRVNEACYMGISPIIVDNTNLQEWEMITYAKYAVMNGYMIEMIIPNTPWAFKSGELARKNIHSVPKQKIEDMLLRFDKNITPISLMQKLGIQYPPGKRPPQFRHYPPMPDNQKKIFNIPPLLQRNNLTKPTQLQDAQIVTLNCTKTVQVPKKKQRQRQRKKNTAHESDNTANIVTISSNLEPDRNNDEIVVLTEEQGEPDSDAWDSDEEEWSDATSSTAKNENFTYIQRDLLTLDDPANMEYILVNSDNSYTYQKDHSNEELVDLINFNDDDNQVQQLIKINDDGNDNEVKNDGSDNGLDVQTRLDNLNAKYLIKYDEENAAKGLFDFPKLDIGQTDSSSWDKLFKSNSNTKINKPERKYSQELLLEMSSSDAGTNTTSADFANLTKSNNDESVKIVFGTARNINDNFIKKLFCPPPKVLMLEKGTITDAENIIETAPKNNIPSKNLSVLRMLFPNVPNDFLQDLLEKCQGDINWAGNLLLESNAEFNENNEIINENEQVNENENENENENDKNVEMEKRVVVNDCENVNDNKNMKHVKNKFKPSNNEELKKHIEEQVRIGDEYYSDHVLNLRKKRYGFVDPPADICNDKEDILLDITADNKEIDAESVSSDEEEIMEFNFGINFIEQLEKQFGNENIEYPKGFQPVIQIPASLGRQLHTLWLESVSTQMQAQNAILLDMEKQDMELAKILQEKEESIPEASNKVPDLQEIMDMEIALAVYRADQEQWKKETPNDLASRMTRQKLFDAFPNLNKDLLTEILQAHDNNFENTVQALLFSLDKTNTDSIINVDGKIMSKTGNEDIAKQKQLLANEIKESSKVKLTKPFENASDDIEDDDYDPKKSANYYRDLASHHLEMRQQLYQKASDAIKKGMPQVASYYSEVAKLHKQKYEYANHQAAAAFLSEHSINHNNSKVIDLHYLYVKEAEQALAMFLDCHISHIQQTKQRQEFLFIITGRGKNSQDGISHIKPVVKRKLKERRLRYVELNPGLLKVTITRNSVLTNDIKDL